MNWFCTHFDIGYLPQGQALHLSLVRHGGDFTLIILCLDTEVEEQLRSLNLPRTQLVPLRQLEASDPRLATAKSGRRKAEYYFTLKPCLCRHVMDTTSEVDFLTYLDSDVFFFNACDSWVAEMRGNDAVVVPHRFPPQSAWREIYGRFNAGCVGFRRSEAGLAALAWWHERCLEWCHDVPDGNRFADQKYLDALADSFAGVLALDHSGVNLAPWNLQEDRLSLDHESRVLVEGKPLVFYHFSGIQRYSRHVFDSGLGEYGSAPGLISRDCIFVPYFKTLAEVTANHPMTVANKNRRTGRRSLSAIVLINSSESPSAHAAELGEVLLAAEDRHNRMLIACEAHIRALDAGGIWLRETLRHAESLSKASLKRNAELEKALQCSATGLFKGFSRRPPTPPNTGAPSLPWQPTPEQILAQVSETEPGTDASPSLPSGPCLFVHCSVRVLGIAAVLAAKGHACVVLGCPGWLKKSSTAQLVFAMESLAEKLGHNPDFLSDYVNVLIDSSDRAWAEHLLDSSAVPSQKVYLLDRSAAYVRGIDAESILRPVASPLDEAPIYNASPDGC